jgi:thioredoxin 1
MAAEPTTTEPVPIDGQAALDDVVAERDVVLADFYADWCGPCTMLEPTLETVAADTDATVVEVIPGGIPSA